MAPARVLVLDGHSRAALETAQSLGRAGNAIDVACESEQCLAFKSRYVNERLRQPVSTDGEQFGAWLRRLDAKHRYDLFVPATETALIAFRALPEEDSIRERAVLPSDHALDVALDKHRTWHLARRLGVAVPRSELITGPDSMPEADSYPLVLKPARSKFWVDGELITREPAIVRDEPARRLVLEAWLPHTRVLQQSYVVGRGVGLEALFERGRMRWHFAHERIHEYPLTGGASTYRRSIPASAELLSSASGILDALQWHGVAMVEFKLAEDGSFVLMEINPRLWGSLALSIDAGVNFPLGLLRLAQSRPLAPQTAYRTPHYTRDLLRDIEWLKENLRARRSDPLLHTRSRIVSLLEFGRVLFARESWDHFDLQDLAVVGDIIKQAFKRLLRMLLNVRRAVSDRDA